MSDERRTGGPPPDADIGSLLGRLPAPRPFDDETAANVVRAAAAEAHRRDRRDRAILLRGGAALMVLLTAGTVTAVVRRWHGGAPVLPPPTSVRAEPVAQPEPQPAAPAPATREHPAPRPVRRERHAMREREPAPSPPPAVAPASDEGALVREAITALGSGDARRALALLDQHDARYPAGALAAEARRIRIQALVAGDRREEALARLEAIDLGSASVPRRDELLLLRAELRATLGRCSTALADFRQLLALPVRPSVGDRAAFGEARCEQRLGRTREAADAFRRYLDRFPNGRFAPDARAALGTSR